ncbi:MAG TPA: nucleotide exchange factor GrpE [Streptosporangiaceae bacterium]|nr:nucleotide exchange factor GrpE [Streptosporangiaceae bacterium]
MTSPEEEANGPVIRDRRRIDPETGQVRDAGWPGQGAGGPDSEAAPRPGRHAAPPPGPPGPGAGHGNGGNGGNGNGGASAAADAAALALAERTADLQRLQAEYANYRKRVERDRVAVREQALANVLGELLPVLDDIGRAREHGELTGGFKSVADSLEAAVAKLGLISYGEDGDPFDPNLHEALMHSYSPDVTEPTCVRVLQPGYKIGDRTLRAARVAVAEPGGDDADGTDSPAGGPEPADTN